MEVRLSVFRALGGILQGLRIEHEDRARLESAKQSIHYRCAQLCFTDLATSVGQYFWKPNKGK